MPKSNKKNNRKVVKTLFRSPKTQKQILDEKLDKHKEEVQKQRKDLEGFRHTLDSLTKSHANHLSLLSNFARHDLKNYVHSIDGIVSTCKADDITDEQLETIRLNVEFIRNTLDEFSKLVVHNEDSSCEFSDLINAINIINRSSFAELSIDFRVDSSVNITFYIPFNIMFQLLNNLVVNAIKALELESISNKIIELKAYVENEDLVIKISDNGKEIDEQNKISLFDYGFSTTGGTGIGLYHAKHLCVSNNGSIIYSDVLNAELAKCFTIMLPLGLET